MTVRERVGSIRLVAVAAVAAMTVASVLVSSAAGGQSLPEGADIQPDWTPPRTAWGVPDLQGVWDYRTMTPLQRPREFAGKTFLTDEEAAAYRVRTLAEQADYDRAPSVHAKWWLDYGTELTADKRTSLIIDPPDGRIPSLTPACACRRRGGVPQSDRALSHVRHAAVTRRLQQQLPNPADAGLRGHPLRDDPRHAGRAPRRPPVSRVAHSAVAW